MGRLWKSRGLHGRGRGLAGGRPGGGGADKAAIIQGKSPVPNTTPLRRPVPSASPGSRATPPPRCSPPVPQCPHSPSDLCWGTKHESSMLPRQPLSASPPSPSAPQSSPTLCCRRSALLQLCTSAAQALGAARPFPPHPGSPQPLSVPSVPPASPFSPPSPSNATHRPSPCPLLPWLRAGAATPQKPFPSQMDLMIHRK